MNIKRIYLLLSFLFVAISGYAQPGSGFRKEYHFMRSGNLVQDKNFYLLTVIERSRAAKLILQKNELLKDYLQQKRGLIKEEVSDSCKDPGCLVNNFEWRQTDSVELDHIIRKIYESNKQVFDLLINSHIRPSGYYERYSKLNNEQILLKAFGQAEMGMNYIIDQYGLGKKLRYPKIDSVSYDVKGTYYRSLLQMMLAEINEQSASMELFYQPTLKIALQLMDLNDRNEPARLEPLEGGENRKAFLQIKNTSWKKFAYSSIMIPGSGPDVLTLPLSPIGKIRCRLGALRYSQGLAPFIIVSGGYVHPTHTPNCEALEMKKYLIQELGITESAIIIEPQARHTTTNIRNANRLIYRYGIPAEKPCLFVSTQSQVEWVANMQPNQNFDDRCVIELGYLPYRDKKYISKHELSYYPTLESLHMDPYDPLDP